MDLSVNADISAPRTRVVDVVGDLSTYPHWLDLVTEATLDEEHQDPSHPAWTITIKAKIGIFSRSKQLRMVRTSFEDGQVLFQRAELDGRQHAAWDMSVTVTPSANENPDTCSIEIGLFYGGSLWSGALEVVLASIVDSSGKRLSRYASQD